MNAEAMTVEGKEALFEMLISIPDERRPGRALGKMKHLGKSLSASDKAIYDRHPLVVKFRRQFREKLRAMYDTEDELTVYADDGERIKHFVVLETDESKEELLERLEYMCEQSYRNVLRDYSPTGLWWSDSPRVARMSKGKYLVYYEDVLDC